jgi:hypothetical protein
MLAFKFGDTGLVGGLPAGGCAKNIIGSNGDGDGDGDTAVAAQVFGQPGHLLLSITESTLKGGGRIGGFAQGAGVGNPGGGIAPGA